MLTRVQQKSSTSARKFNPQEVKPATSWDDAIYEAEQMIKTKKQELARLRESIKTFERLRAANEPFPNDTLSGTG